MDFLMSILSDYTFRVVALGAGFLGIISGVLGSFAVLRKQSLIGDALSHCALPGICIAFLLTGQKKLEILLLGAFISALIGYILISILDKYSKIKFDTALAAILSVFFGMGLVGLTFIQKKPNASQAGLDKFIFGQASTMLKRDLTLITIVGIIVIFLVILFWKEFKLISFDPIFAETIGFSNKKIIPFLSMLIVVAIIIGLQTVGVVLMSSMLIAPGVAARQWTNRLWLMVVLAALFGFLAGVIGTIFSSAQGQLPTGPSIIVVITIIVFISILFSPNRGLIYSLSQRKRNKKNIIDAVNQEKIKQTNHANKEAN